MGATTLLGSAFRLGRRLPASSFDPDVELALTAELGDAHILPGAPTRVWRFSGRVLKGPANSLDSSLGSYLGPTLRLRRGQKVRIHFNNHLPDPSIVHWHGLDVPEAADGHPRFAVPGGGRYVYEFEVTNRAGTYWYHPHPHMQTGEQVYCGLLGVLTVSDEEEAALELPAGAQDLLCVLQDRRFDAANQLVYAPTMMESAMGFLGDRMLVNGTPTPTWELSARAYRVRLLNGSNARIYKLAWSDGTPMTVIGTDGGLLERPMRQRVVTLAPAQRVDVWLDLGGRRAGSTIALRSEPFPASDAAPAMGMGGMGMGMAGRGVMRGGGSDVPLGAPLLLLTIVVSRSAAAEARVPLTLTAYGRAWRADRSAPVRRVPLTFARMEWSLDGRTFGMTDVADAETVIAGSTHVWEFVNQGGPMGMQAAHPIHLHGHQFRVLSRTGGGQANALREGVVDAGWTDTVLVLPGETVRVQVTFSGHPGLYLYHCHILEHEDMGMMRNFRVVSG
jgi:FtsP/CotA-like multicopper oxidase with cupredoxin domain